MKEMINTVISVLQEPTPERVSSVLDYLRNTSDSMPDLSMLLFIQAQFTHFVEHKRFLDANPEVEEMLLATMRAQFPNAKYKNDNVLSADLTFVEGCYEALNQFVTTLQTEALLREITSR